MKIKDLFSFITKSVGGHYGNKEPVSLQSGFVPMYLVDTISGGFKFGENATDVMPQAYSGNPYVYMVIDRIATRASQIPKLVLGEDGEEVTSIDFRVQGFLEKPNSKQSFVEFFYSACSTYLGAGQVFIWAFENNLTGDKEFLIPVNQNVRIHEDEAGVVKSYTIRHFSKSYTAEPSSVLHIKKPNLAVDTNYGFSALQAGRQVWESNNEVWGSEATIHRNKGVSGVLYADGKVMSPREQKELQAQYDSQYTQGGNRAFGKVKVSPAKLGYISMGMNPNDLKSLETKEEHLRTICSIFNVDPKLFGDTKASTYNNVKEAKQDFILNAVLPVMEVICINLMPFAAEQMGSPEFRVAPDKTKIVELSVPNLDLTKKVTEEVKAGIITVEEAKEILYPNK